LEKEPRFQTGQSRFWQSIFEISKEEEILEKKIKIIHLQEVSIESSSQSGSQ
jgi:hypothetical protein